MATLDDEIKAAEKKMRQAYDALIEYVERPASQPADIRLHRRLADDLTLANAHYVTLVSKLSLQVKKAHLLWQRLGWTPDGHALTYSEGVAAATLHVLDSRVAKAHFVIALVVAGFMVHSE